MARLSKKANGAGKRPEPESSKKPELEKSVVAMIRRLKGPVVVVESSQLKPWQSIAVVLFVAGFLSALVFSAASKFADAIRAAITPNNLITNVANVDYEDTAGTSFGPSTSNTVNINILPPTPPPDTIPPDPIDAISIQEATVGSITLIWQAPADDDGDRVASYDIRYAEELITNNNWERAVIVTQNMTPKDPDKSEKLTVYNLTADSIYWLGIKSSDAASNVSTLSNVAKGQTLKDLPPIDERLTKIKVKLNPEGRLRREFPDVELKLFDGISDAMLVHLTIPTDENGLAEATLPEILRKGKYHVLVHVRGFLDKKIKNLDLTDELEVEFDDLAAGNLNDDDEINGLDWTIMSSKWGTNDQSADLNQDTTVNSLDFSFMNKHWGRRGDDEFTSGN
jgi:hypothetical protein